MLELKMFYKNTTKLHISALLIVASIFCVSSCSKKESVEDIVEEYDEVKKECSQKLINIKKKYKRALMDLNIDYKGNHVDLDREEGFFDPITIEVWGLDDNNNEIKSENDDDSKYKSIDSISDNSSSNKNTSQSADSKFDFANDLKTHDSNSEKKDLLDLNNKNEISENSGLVENQKGDNHEEDKDNDRIANVEKGYGNADNIESDKNSYKNSDAKSSENIIQVAEVAAQPNSNEANQSSEAPKKDLNDTKEKDDTSHGTIDGQKTSDVGMGLMIISNDDIVLGNKDSDIVIIEYSSYSCPHCGYFHETFFHNIDRDFIKTNKIAYVIREFISNRQDMDATALARCGDKLYGLDLYTKLRNIIFNRQEAWAFNKNFSEILTNIGQIAGISPEDYAKCVNDEGLQKFLLQHSKEAFGTKGFRGTPFFVINGKPLSRPFNKLYEEIVALLDAKKK